MIRDPRAIASSLKKRKITIGSVDNQGWSFNRSFRSFESDRLYQASSIDENDR